MKPETLVLGHHHSQYASHDTHPLTSARSSRCKGTAFFVKIQTKSEKHLRISLFSYTFVLENLLVNWVMSETKYTYNDLARSRIYSSLFSRKVVDEVLRGEYESVNKVYQLLDETDQFSNSTYLDYFAYLYQSMMQNYRCEYVFKNEVINKVLLSHFRNAKTVSISEFHVNQSIADLAMFNGISRAYEIKTDYDSDKRLGHQLADYQRLFDKCYLVISEHNISKYLNTVPEEVGVITLTYKKKTLVHNVLKKARMNNSVDVYTLMRSVRATEYRNIVRQIYGALPDVSEFEMFDACEKILMDANNAKVRTAFLQEMKKRRMNTHQIAQFDPFFRQLCMATNISSRDYCTFKENLLNKITL